jgi:hypothetical protein
MARDPGDLSQLVHFLNHPGDGWTSPLRLPAARSVSELQQLERRYKKALDRSYEAAGDELR